MKSEECTCGRGFRDGHDYCHCDIKYDGTPEDYNRFIKWVHFVLLPWVRKPDTRKRYGWFVGESSCQLDKEQDIR